MSKLLYSLREAIEKSGLKDGMTISFHHHFRGGDYVLNMVLNEIAKMGKPILSLMRQFTPTGRGEKKRAISSLEFKTVLAHALKLGLDRGFVQDEESANDKYIPSF